MFKGKKTARVTLSTKRRRHGSTCALVHFLRPRGDCQLSGRKLHGNPHGEGALQQGVRTNSKPGLQLEVCSTPAQKATGQPKPKRVAIDTSPIERGPFETLIIAFRRTLSFNRTNDPYPPRSKGKERREKPFETLQRADDAGISMQ